MGVFLMNFVMEHLSELINHITHGLAPNADDLQISGIALDSRSVGEGYVFVALSGTNVDGHAYIHDAIQRGAAIIVGSKDLEDLAVPYIQVADARSALAEISAAFYDYPARKMTMIGVTGTDGKTTTANLIFSILKEAGIRAGMITTVNALIGSQLIDTGFHVTTPEAPEVQCYLAQMVEAGLTHVVLETTSHGLEQQRVGGCEFDIGVVTNITHEHLDYHRTYEAYLAAKSLLLTSLADTPPKVGGNFYMAVINRDDQSFNHLSEIISSAINTITYGLSPDADLWARDVEHGSEGTAFTAVGSKFEIRINTNLLGKFSIDNILAALGVTVLGLGIDHNDAQAGIASLKRIEGRMETISLGQKFLTMVDFAHTPNALTKAIETGRLLSAGRVIAVFGSAGLRDREKRKLMAKVSSELADLTILTAEDPRTEPLDAILAEMAAGAVSVGGVENQSFWRIPDRGEAIRFALNQAQADDIVLICGKGHEQSMCFGETEYPWDDRTAARAALAEHLSVQGPKMLRLPTSTSFTE